MVEFFLSKNIEKALILVILNYWILLIALLFSAMNIQKNFVSYVYLAIAMAGAIFPVYSNIKFVQLYGPGFNIFSFINLATNNPASQSLSFDLFFLSSAVFLWMFIESRRLSLKHFWIVVLGTFSIAIAFSAPLFLFLRERRLIELET